jgi:hypothetical protein
MTIVHSGMAVLYQSMKSLMIASSFHVTASTVRRFVVMGGEG